MIYVKTIDDINAKNNIIYVIKNIWITTPYIKQKRLLQ